MTEATTRIVIVDDHPLVREGIRTFVQTQSDLEVVGEAATGEEALAVVAAQRPDLVLLDLVLGEERGGDLITPLRIVSPNSHVLVLTSFGDEKLCIPAIRAGALGVVLKTVSPAGLVDAMRAVARGESAIEPHTARRLAEIARSPWSSPDNALHRLTPREREVLELIADGRTNQEIATELAISEKTVKGHVSAVLGKLQVDDRLKAAVFMWKTGRPGGGR